MTCDIFPLSRSICICMFLCLSFVNWLAPMESLSLLLYICCCRILIPPLLGKNEDSDPKDPYNAHLAGSGHFDPCLHLSIGYATLCTAENQIQLTGVFCITWFLSRYSFWRWIRKFSPRIRLRWRKKPGPAWNIKNI